MLRVTHMLPMNLMGSNSTAQRIALVQATQEVVASAATTTVGRGRAIFEPRDVEVIIGFYAEESAIKAYVLTTIDIIPPRVYVDDWQTKPEEGAFRDKLEDIARAITGKAPWLEIMAPAFNQTASMHIHYRELSEDVNAVYTHCLEPVNA